MPNENRSNVTIPPAVITTITNALNDIKTALDPYLTPLNPDERQSMAKMSDKSLAFVNKAHDYTQSNPEFMPAFIPMADFETDFVNVTAINPLAKLALTIADSLIDTATVSGSEAFYAARAYYNNVKLGESNGAASARTIHGELKKRYPGRPAAAAADAETPPKA